MESPFDSILFDRQFVALLLMSIIGKEKLVNNSYSKLETRYVKGKVSHFDLKNITFNILLISPRYRYFQASSEE